MIISIVLLIFFASLAVQVPSIPAVSRGYPMVLLIISAVMTVILLVKSLVKLKGEKKQPTEVAAQAKTIVPYCILIALYLFLMGKIGYIVSTVLFMIVSLLYLKLKNKIVLVVLSVVMTIILYFVFTNYLMVILPRGTWFNISF